MRTKTIAEKIRRIEQLEHQAQRHQMTIWNIERKWNRLMEQVGETPEWQQYLDEHGIRKGYRFYDVLA